MGGLSDKLLANKRFDFRSMAFDAEKFAVVKMEGFEAISQPFRFALTLVSADPSIDFEAMLSRPATFTIYDPKGGTETPYHGVLAEFEQLHRADGYVFYRAVLVPRIWRLSLYRISEVYLGEQPITETIETAFRHGQLSSSDYALRLSGTYRARSFVCQYEETHLDFVSRWMENEGIYYYFDHEGGTGKLVAVDDRIMLDGQAVQVDYRPDDELDTGVSGRVVRDFVCRQKPLPKEVVLQDYNHRKAALQLKVSATVSDTGVGQVMLYGENFRDETEGRRYAKLRAEEILCRGKVFAGEATAVGLRSGRFAELSGHYRDDFNGRYLVTEIHHEGSQAGALLSGIRNAFGDSAAGGETSYRNSFRAVPAAVQFRPARATSKPCVAGTMNAVVDSEGSGQYAELDEFGQYKVQLPFDLTDKAANRGSARVRMATPYSGSDHGMHFPLLKGSEVLLSFIDGDPDRPVIVGSVPNSENRSVVNVANPRENLINTRGNQVRMSDVPGKEVMWLSSKFHDSSIGIGSIDPRGGGSIFTATKGSSDSWTFGASNSMSFGSKNSLSIGTDTSVSAAVGNSVSIGAKVGISCSSNINWNMNLTGPFNGLQSFTIDDGKTVKLTGEDSETFALDKVELAAGHDLTDAKVTELKANLTGMKAFMGAFTILNAAQSAVFSAVLTGDLTPDNKPAKDAAKERDIRGNAARQADLSKEQSDEMSQADARSDLTDDEKKALKDSIRKKYADQGLKPSDYSVMTDANFYNGWPGIVTKVGTDVVADVAALAILQGYARTAKSRLATIKLKSRITLDKDAAAITHASAASTGELKLDKDAASAEYKSGTATSQVRLAKDIVSITQVDTDQSANAQLMLTQGTVDLEANKSVLLKAATTTTLKMTEDKAELQLGDAKLVLVNGGDAALQFGNAGIVANAQGLLLSMSSSKVELKPVGLRLDGTTLNLG